jgi:hypothetical protein
MDMRDRMFAYQKEYDRKVANYERTDDNRDTRLMIKDMVNDFKHAKENDEMGRRTRYVQV